MDPSAAAPGTDASSSRATVERPHVLLVDDDSKTRTRSEKLFRNQACRVTTAESALKALEILGLADNEQTSGNDSIPKFHLIVAALEMPETNGYDLLKKIKESSTLKDVPVVLVSSEDDVDMTTDCLEAGAVLIMDKPLDEWGIDQVVMKVI